MTGFRRGLAGQPGLPGHSAVRDANVNCPHSIASYSLQGKTVTTQNLSGKRTGLGL